MRQKSVANPVYSYVPNLIGYARIVFSLLAFAFDETAPLLFITFYTIGFALDWFDGIAARKFNQCSRFGVLLDMVTDRAATTALFCVLYETYVGTASNFAKFLLSCGVLDLVSHWVAMYTSVSLECSHKKMWTKDAATQSWSEWCLKVYYENINYSMDWLMIGHEGFLLLLFLRPRIEQSFALDAAIMALAPLFGLKVMVHIIQLAKSTDQLAELDRPDESQ